MGRLNTSLLGTFLYSLQKETNCEQAKQEMKKIIGPDNNL